MSKRATVIHDEDGFDLPPLDKEDGTSYGFFDRWNVGTTPDGKLITDYSDWEARDLFTMLAKDYKSREMENVLVLPIVSAERQIVEAKGDKGEKEWLEAYWEQDHLNGGCKVPLDHIIDQTTSAFMYKRAYFEKVWTKGSGDFEGKIVYDTLGWRPQTTCRIMRDPQHGSFQGFEQEAYYLGPEINNEKKWPIQVPPKRAFVYTNGTRRDPINGTSDMEIAYWAWKTKQKILLLWFQFLQAVSLPRIVVKANDIDTARGIAKEIARMKSSGVLPVAMPGGAASVGIETLDVSGKGADQFQAAITWLDNAATQSILAGFLNLTNRGMPMEGTGSFALSKDASDFYLQSEEAKAREIEYQVRKNLFAPLIRHNFGPKAAVPKLAFEPLNDIDKSTSVSLLQSSMAAPPGGPIPVEFIAALAGQVSEYIGLDGSSMKEAFTQSFTAAAVQAKEQAAQQGVNPAGQAVAGMAGAVGAASKAANGGKIPSKNGGKQFPVKGNVPIIGQKPAVAAPASPKMTPAIKGALDAKIGKNRTAAKGAKEPSP